MKATKSTVKAAKYTKSAPLGVKLSGSVESRRARIATALEAAGVTGCDVFGLGPSSYVLPASSSVAIIGGLRILVDYTTVVAFETRAVKIATPRSLYSRTTDRSVDKFFAGGCDVNVTRTADEDTFHNELHAAILGEGGRAPAPAVYEVKDALGWVRAAGLSAQVTENAVEAVQRAYDAAREATPALPPIWTVKTLREVIAKVEADIG